MGEPKYIFPEDIKPLVDKTQEKRTKTMRVYFSKGTDNGGEKSGENRKPDDGKRDSAE